MKPALPIDVHLPEIVASVRKNTCTILQADPGSGKTTRLPPALLAANLFYPEQKILVLVPRRLACVQAARRVAFENGETLGGRIGYTHRYEAKTNQNTRLEYITEGIFLNRMAADPKLSEVGCVILDEFHERHVATDVSLMLVRLLQKKERPDLKLVVMSATLETEKLGEFLAAQCLVFQVPRYPVKIIYDREEKFSAGRIHEACLSALKRLSHHRERGDILIFLPGWKEIEKTRHRIEENFGDDFFIVRLHGDGDPGEHEKAFQSSSRPKIILSTPIAESSLTFPGVTTVIDSGLKREAKFDAWSGLRHLRTVPISQFSAEQRAGRAGRMAPGLCIRLFDEAEFLQRPRADLPEIQRTDLSRLILDLKRISLDFSFGLPWFENPRESSWNEAVQQLHAGKALAANDFLSPLTEIGKSMAQTGLPLWLAGFLLAAPEDYRLSFARLVARLEEGSFQVEDAVQDLERGDSEKEKIFCDRIFSRLHWSRPTSVKKDLTSPDFFSAVKQAALQSFSDHVARRVDNSNSDFIEYRACQGGRWRLKVSGKIAAPEWLVILDGVSSGNGGSIAAFVAVEDVDLIAISEKIRSVSEMSWDEKRRDVFERVRLIYGDLVLEETSRLCSDWMLRGKMIQKEIFGIPLEINVEGLTDAEFLNRLQNLGDVHEVENLLARRNLFLKFYPEVAQDFPKWSEIFSQIKISEKPLVQLPDEFLQRIDPLFLRRFTSEVPVELTSNRQRRIPVHYALGRAPWISLRIQDAFGWNENPKILSGKMSLIVDLLAPNGRSVQVTSDLAGFWKNLYPQLRVELKRRYPKHDFPEIRMS